VIFTYDCEFLEDGSTIELVSIGIVCEDGCEYYAVSSEFDQNRIKADEWLVGNVWRYLPREHDEDGVSQWGKLHPDLDNEWIDLDDRDVKPRAVIAREVAEFILGPKPDDQTWPAVRADPIQLWADYCAYDHVALAQLYGKMLDLPPGMPMWTHDIQTLVEARPGLRRVRRGGSEHNALADAQHNMAVLRAAGLVVK
jgi:hypothetical protein